MKFWLLASLLVSGLSGAHADVDLDQEMVRPTGFALTTKPALDLSAGFPDISDQSPLSACQSFAMAAWLDYIFYFKTGHVIELSEKYLAYRLLEFMADEFWDPATQTYPTTYLGQSALIARPFLASGVAPLMLASYFKTQVIPRAVYSFGELNATEGNIGLDFDVYNEFFEQDSVPVSRDQYLKQLPVAFLSSPPERFVYKLPSVDFSSGKGEVLTLNTATDLGALLDLNDKNVKTYYNLEYRAFLAPLHDPKAVADYLHTISQHFGQISATVSKTKLLSAIRTSLDRRMPVMMAGTVWVGDWKSGVVLKDGGGHALVIVGYQDRDDGKTYFKIRNSWGKDNGIKGYDYIDGETLGSNTMYIVVPEI